MTTPIGPLDVTCVQCGAQPGEACHTPTGREKADYHAARERAAEEPSPEVEEWTEEDLAAARETTEDPADQPSRSLSCVACGGPGAVPRACSVDAEDGPADWRWLCDDCAELPLADIDARIAELADCPELCGEGGQPSPEDEVSTREYRRTIHCQLPDDEIVERTLSMLQLEREVEKIKEDAKRQVKPRQEQIAALKTQIREGEERSILCLERRYYRTGELTVVRMDTLEEIERRALTAEERQQELPLVEPVEGEGEGELTPDELPLGCEGCTLQSDCGRVSGGDPHPGCRLEHPTSFEEGEGEGEDLDGTEPDDDEAL